MSTFRSNDPTLDHNQSEGEDFATNRAASILEPKPKAAPKTWASMFKSSMASNATSTPFEGSARLALSTPKPSWKDPAGTDASASKPATPSVDEAVKSSSSSLPAAVQGMSIVRTAPSDQAARAASSSSSSLPIVAQAKPQGTTWSSIWKSTQPKSKTSTPFWASAALMGPSKRPRSQSPQNYSPAAKLSKVTDTVPEVAVEDQSMPDVGDEAEYASNMPDVGGEDAMEDYVSNISGDEDHDISDSEIGDDLPDELFADNTQESSDNLDEELLALAGFTQAYESDEDWVPSNRTARHNTRSSKGKTRALSVSSNDSIRPREKRSKKVTCEESCPFCDFSTAKYLIYARKANMHKHLSIHMVGSIPKSSSTCVLRCGHPLEIGKDTRSLHATHLAQAHLRAWLQSQNLDPRAYGYEQKATEDEVGKVLEAIEKCGENRGIRKTAENFLSTVSDRSRSILIILRSSSRTPITWGTPSVFIASMQQRWLNAYKSLSGDTRNHAHTLWSNNASTQFIPHANGHPFPIPAGRQDSPERRHLIKRALRFSEEIQTFLDAAWRRSPVIISIGLDAFTCNAELLQVWLQIVPAFQLVILTKDEEEDLGQVETNGFYLVIFDSTAIERAMCGHPAADPRIVKLLEIWETILNSKAGLTNLRHRIGIVRRHEHADETESMDEDEPSAEDEEDAD